MDSPETQSFDGSEIAVVGMACQFPKANDLEMFWENLRNSAECISFLSDEELQPSGVDPASLNDPNYVKAASILDGVDLFDAAFFGIPANEARVMDPQHRILLQCGWKALEDAGYNPETYKGAIGVYAGARSSSYLFNLYSNPEITGSIGAFEIGLGNDPAFLTSRLSYKLNLRGPSYSVHTACSTSLVAVHLACQSLLVGECQMALAGGVAVNVPQKTGYLYRRGGILSPDGHCCAFDEKAQGTIFGSGAGVLALKRLEDALRDSDHIYALIRGSATNNDGWAKASFTAPSVQGQASVILDALATAGVEADSISYIEAHGTGTHIGDPIEIKALTRAFRARTAKKGFCGIGSVKSNLGHLDAAAGMASIIKLILCFEHNTLVPTLHYSSPNPQMDLDNSPFYVVDKLKEWKSGPGPRRAGVSAFGVGGTNAHLVLEEAPPTESSGEGSPWQLLALSAKSAKALDDATSNLASYFRRHPQISLADAAYTLAIGRVAFKHRRAVVCRNEAGNAVRELESSLALPQESRIEDDIERPIAFLFPGQGAQYVNMGRDLYEHEPVFREQITRCADILRGEMGGAELLKVLYPAEGEDKKAAERELNRTWLTQCTLFAVEYALAELWQSWGIRPQAMIGHSLGEYVAACVAGVLPLEEMLKLVAARGKIMQESPAGAMLAVEWNEKEAALRARDGLSLAAINGPAQCVLSGSAEAIEAVEKQLEQERITCRRLPGSSAFHSHLMEQAAARFREVCRKAQFQPPKIQYVSNVSGTWIRDSEATDPEYWVRHLRQTVRFSDGLSAIMAQQPAALLEVGPGQTLGRLARVQLRGNAQLALASLHPQEPEQQFLRRSLARLWLKGAPVDWQGYYRAEKRRRVSLPTYPFEGERYWVEAQAAGGEADGAPGISRLGGLKKQSNIGNWFYVPSWKPGLALETENTAAPERWLVFADELGVGDAIAERLESLGHGVVRARAGAAVSRENDRSYVVRPDDRQSYEFLFECLKADDQIPQKIIHCFSLTGQKGASGAGVFRALQETGYYSLLYLAQAIAKIFKDSACDVTVVSNHLAQLPGEEAGMAEKASVMAPCVLVPQENPNFSFRCLDIGQAGLWTEEKLLLAQQVISEAVHGTREKLVAFRGAQRWAQVYERVNIGPQNRQLRTLQQGGIYLITGGLGSVGLLVAEQLARTLKPKLVLTARQALPPRATWQGHLDKHGAQDTLSARMLAVLKLEELGAEVVLSNADAANDEQMKELIDEVYERFGRLNGVIHAAGITSGSSLYRSYGEIGKAESEEQFGPKVYGTYALRDALKGRAFDFCVLFSSNAAVLGGLGYLTYTAANSFMDAFAEEQARQDARWISASWDPWPRETKKLEYQTSIDQYAMTAEESLEAFERIVTRCPAGRIIVSTGDLLARLNLWMATSPEQASGKKHSRSELASTYVAPGNDIERRIETIWEQVLGISNIGIHDSFFDLGGHSLLAIRLMNQVCEEFQLGLPIAKLFENPTIAGLARLVGESESGQEPKDEVLKLLAELPD
jgi:phthiocerol/phenolphthiocerol synthesis type-I polyketide synthase E